ncbi:MAG TPA: hypothetical protein VKF32_05555 [Thermoanaerobaculia bacterium]|nr:hypothetical protein [Thermoanaerobaculia bacterium]
MDDEKPDGEPHEDRVNRAFDALHEVIGDRLSKTGSQAVERLRAAAAGRDAASVKAHLESVKESDSWLYRELTKHPDVAALINELAVWGF